MLAINEVKTMQSSNTLEGHFLVQMEGGIIVRNHMEVHCLAHWNT